MVERFGTTVRISIDGEEILVAEDTTVAAALLNHGLTPFRRSVHGQPRAPLCGIGSCFECRAVVDGRPQTRTCTILCREGMEVRTDA